MQLIHHGVDVRGTFCIPSLKEAADHFKIPKLTICGWKVEYSESFVTDKTCGYALKWPGLEEQLYQLFLKRRSKSQIVTTSWFRMRSREIYRSLYLSLSGLFTFSIGWYRGFLQRYNIVKRRVMKQSSKRPKDYINIVNMFLRFIRRVSSIKTQSRAVSRILNSLKRRFQKRLILNLDETPIPFEFLDGSTWETKGAKTVASHTDRSRWNKRQATLILYIFADDIHRLQLKLIFYGVPTEKGG